MRLSVSFGKLLEDLLARRSEIAVLPPTPASSIASAGFGYRGIAFDGIAKPVPDIPGYFTIDHQG